jgi:hypothetical protein
VANPENLKPAEQGNALALKHGAHSEARIRPVARAQRRRFLRRNGLKARELGGVPAAYLDAWARAAAKVELIDQYVAERGLLKEDGEPQAAMKIYVALLNSSTRAMARLEESLRADKGRSDETLSDYVGRVYGGQRG